MLNSVCARRLKMALRDVYARSSAHNSAESETTELHSWLSWARRSRLESFTYQSATIRERFDAVVRGMLGHSSNAFVEAMNGLMQQAKRAPRGLRTSRSFFAIAYPSMSTLKLLAAHPFGPTIAR